MVAEGRFWKILLPILAIVFFFASIVLLAPWLTQRTTVKYIEGDNTEVKSGFPVILVTRKAPEAKSPKFIVAHWSTLKRVTAETPDFSFLLPLGKSAIVDQDGDPASFNAEEISPGRQRIRLKAVVSDYTYEVEYEAEANSVFPRSLTVNDLKAGVMLAIPCGLVLTLAGYFLATRLIRRRHQSEHKIPNS